MKEPHYVFVKGEGWVPRNEPEPEPKPAPITDHKTYWYLNDYVPVLPLNTRTLTEYRYYYTHDEWLTYTAPRPAQETERVYGPAAPAPRVRYYPGSNQPAEVRPAQETERERMIRQYRERIQRRGQRP